METPSLPPIATLTSATTSPETKTSTLDTLFEPSQTLHGLVIPLLSASYPSYSVLVAAIRTLLLALAQKGDADHDSDEEKKLVEILGAHPRLGAKKVDSVLSRMEQERAGLNTDQGASAAQEEEARLLAQLNKEYEEKFPGLRYVYVFFSLSCFFCPILIRGNHQASWTNGLSTESSSTHARGRLLWRI